MSALNNHVILSHIDTPARLLFWPVGQVILCILPIMFGIIIDQFLVGASMSVFVMIGLKFFNKRFGKGRFNAISYWYLPTSKRLIALGIPPSHVRLWIR